MLIWISDIFGEKRVAGAKELGIKSLIGLAMTLAVLIFDPLEIGSRMERHSRDVFNGIFGSEATATPSTADVAVVVLNETTLRALARPWPLSYAMHSDILDAIQGYSPKAVVVDILFVDQLRSDPSLAELAETLRAPGGDRRRAKTFLASIPGPMGGTAILRELDPANWDDATDRSELVTIDMVPGDGAHSPYVLLRESGPDSPAFAVYRDLCATGRLTNCANAPARLDFAFPMEIQWPVGTPDRGAYPGLVGGDCSPGPAGTWARIFAVALKVGGLGNLRQSCPPYTAVLAQYLLHPGGREEALDRALRDKVVFYGVSITGSADSVSVGHVDRPLPGVFVHAAAFENLTRFGTRYLTGEPRSRWWSEALTEFFLAVAMSLLVFVGSRRTQILLHDSKSRFGPPPFARRLLIAAGSWFFFAVAAAVLCVAAIVVERFLLGVAPSNWIALLTMSTATLAMMESAFKND